jgi:hypothetical protein
MEDQNNFQINSPITSQLSAFWCAYHRLRNTVQWLRGPTQYIHFLTRRLEGGSSAAPRNAVLQLYIVRLTQSKITVLIKNRYTATVRYSTVLRKTTTLFGELLRTSADAVTAFLCFSFPFTAPCPLYVNNFHFTFPLSSSRSFLSRSI